MLGISCDPGPVEFGVSHKGASSEQLEDGLWSTVGYQMLIMFCRMVQM